MGSERILGGNPPKCKYPRHPHSDAHDPHEDSVAEGEKTCTHVCTCNHTAQDEEESDSVRGESGKQTDTCTDYPPHGQFMHSAFAHEVESDSRKAHTNDEGKSDEERYVPRFERWLFRAKQGDKVHIFPFLL